MRPEEGDPARLWDMLDHATAVASFVQGRTLDEYVENRLLRSAVEREIEVIGEAARAVSASFKTSHPEIRWSGIIAQRHVLAHEYGEIKHERLWRVATIRIPELIRLLEPLVPETPKD